MLKVSCDHGVCEIDAQGDAREVMTDAMCIILAIHDGLGDKNPAAQMLFRDLLKDDEAFERFGKAKQAKVRATDENRKIANKVIKLRKELENND